MRWRIVAGLAATAVVAVPTLAVRQSQTQRKIPPAVVAAARAFARDSARPAHLTTPLRGVRRERFAGGWLWIVDTGRMNDASLCGTGGCDVQFWLPRAGGGYARIFDRRVLSYAITGRHGAQPVVHVEHHGSLCGEEGNSACATRYRWTRETSATGGRLVVAPAGGDVGTLLGPLPAAITPEAERVPSSVRAALDEMSRRCRARGGRASVDPDELPDLDGDGRSEWAISGLGFACERDGRPLADVCGGACPTMVFATAGGAVRRVYAGRHVRYLLSYRGPRARLLIAPVVDGVVPITGRVLVFARGLGPARLAQ